MLSIYENNWSACQLNGGNISLGEMGVLAGRAASYVPDVLPSVTYYGGSQVAPHLCVRWTSEYDVNIDSEIIHISAVVGYGLSVSSCPQVRLPVTRGILALRTMIKDCCLRALEYPGQQFNINFDSDIRSFQRVNTEAESKSLLLMKEWLTPQQCADFEKYSAINVIGGSTGYCYRLTCSTSFNIELGFSGAAAIEKYSAFDVIGGAICVEPDRREVRTQGDRLLAQKIGLEACELELLRIAKVNMAAAPLVAQLLIAGDVFGRSEKLDLIPKENPAAG